MVNGLSGAVESRSAFGMLEFVRMFAASVSQGALGGAACLGTVMTVCSQASMEVRPQEAEEMDAEPSWPSVCSWGGPAQRGQSTALRLGIGGGRSP